MNVSMGKSKTVVSAYTRVVREVRRIFLCYLCYLLLICKIQYISTSTYHNYFPKDNSKISTIARNVVTVPTKYWDTRAVQFLTKYIKV